MIDGAVSAVSVGKAGTLENNSLTHSDLLELLLDSKNGHLQFVPVDLPLTEYCPRKSLIFVANTKSIANFNSGCFTFPDSLYSLKS